MFLMCVGQQQEEGRAPLMQGPPLLVIAVHGIILIHLKQQNWSRGGFKEVN